MHTIIIRSSRADLYDPTFGTLGNTSFTGKVTELVTSRDRSIPEPDYIMKLDCNLT